MSRSDRGGNLGLLAACVLPFIILATANSAGYRYGASDQAFYVPAILNRIDPTLYPRDSQLIRSQARLTLIDEVLGPVARATGTPLSTVFFVLQLTTLSLLALAALGLGGVFYRTRWATVALMAALTLRHAITKSGTNTLEGYFHPRQLSFAIAALAVVSFLRGRYGLMCALVAVAGAVHPTTAFWFAVWLSVATIVSEPRLRAPIAAGVAAATAAGVWALLAGPLAGRLVRMDAVWLETLATKDYLFPLDWPASAWLINLAYAPIIIWIYRRRRAAELVMPREGALVVGCLSLVLVFAATLPFNAARLALAIQLQPSRIFWMLDFLAIIYVVWAAAEGVSADARRARIVALGIVVLATVRGSYIMFVEFPDRRMAQVRISDDDWGRAMAWARNSRVDSGWLADPGHAVRYGTSVRVAGERDVFVEAIKDGAVGMYDRSVALRTRERVEALGDFTTVTAERARALASQYDLDYLVSEGSIDLPLEFSSGAVKIYRLR
jgi:hypothetical protein